MKKEGLANEPFREPKGVPHGLASEMRNTLKLEI
jgi:hypothetical protein